MQSTVYALNALIYIGNFEQNSTNMAIESAFSYIQNNSITDEFGVHWKGGVFFRRHSSAEYTILEVRCLYNCYNSNCFANYRMYLEQRYNIIN